MKTNSTKEDKQKHDQKTAATKAPNKNGNSSAPVKADSSNKGKGPKGENL